MRPLFLLAAGAAVLIAATSKRGKDVACYASIKARALLENVALPHAIPPLGCYQGRISSGYGVRVHPVTGQEGSMHSGVDLPAPEGTPVYAPVDLKVTRIDRAGTEGGKINGNCIHATGEGYTWAFLHLSKVNVTVGQTVSAGTCIGLVGTTGRSTGPHLHVQTSLYGQTVNPKLVLPLLA